ncbi:hypothetical protein M8818_006938 [Zalaria obscura]|uniref:Uncharacterized protein n=1 Tax=Zalaria obscura TaxID=2024903 RepID=A0ACC3S5A9_9PEZI
MESLQAIPRHLLSHLPALLTITVALPLLGLLSFYLWATPSTWKDSRRKHLPPGPRGLPFVGNFFDFSDDQLVPQKAQRWAQKYGDVFYTKIGGSDYIWLSSPQSIKDLMDKRSSIYSSRPPAPLSQDVASGGRRQLFMQYGPQYRVVRKISHALLNTTISTSYQPVQDYESKQLMQEILDDPAHFYDYNRRYSASLIIRITYGYRIPKIYGVLDNFQKMTKPGAFLIETFPSLKVLPEWMVQNWRTFGQKIFEHDHKIYLGLWRELKSKVENGTAPPCFVKDFMESDFEKQGIRDELQAAYQAGGLVEAGAETTSAFLNTFIRQMAMNPRVAKAAQEEIDRVIGDDRLPTFEDEPNLPYIRSIIKENLRLCPPNKLGMHHATTEDDWYNGHFIPKGATVILNWWAVHKNPAIWEDPEEFRPERYLKYDLPAAAYLNVADPMERDHLSYGAGRRVCPGIHVAEKSMFINIARMIWAFDISKKMGADGHVVEPDCRTEKGWMTVPVRFEVDLKVRSADRAAIIRKTFQEAEAKGMEWSFKQRLS